MSDKPAVQPEDGEDLDLAVEDEEPVEGEESEAEAPEGEEPPEAETEEEPAAAAPTRAQTRIQSLRERAEKAEREAAELRGYRQALEQRAAPQSAADPYAQQRQQEALFQRWNQMHLEGQGAQAQQEMWQLGQQHIQNAVMALQVQTNDRIDKQSYDAKALSSRPHQRHAAEVERILADQRARSNLAITREDILLRLVGQEAIANANRAAPQQRRQASGRVAAQQTRPGGARGDGGAASRRPAPGTPEHDDLLLDEYFSNGGTL